MTFVRGVSPSYTVYSTSFKDTRFVRFGTLSRISSVMGIAINVSCMYPLRFISWNPLSIPIWLNSDSVMMIVYGSGTFWASTLAFNFLYSGVFITSSKGIKALLKVSFSDCILFLVLVLLVLTWSNCLSLFQRVAISSMLSVNAFGKCWEATFILYAIASKPCDAASLANLEIIGSTKSLRAMSSLFNRVFSKPIPFMTNVFRFDAILEASTEFTIACTNMCASPSMSVNGINSLSLLFASSNWFTNGAIELSSMPLFLNVSILSSNLRILSTSLGANRCCISLSKLLPTNTGILTCLPLGRGDDQYLISNVRDAPFLPFSTPLILDCKRDNSLSALSMFILVWLYRSRFLTLVSKLFSSAVFSVSVMSGLSNLFCKDLILRCDDSIPLSVELTWFFNLCSWAFKSLTVIPWKSCM